MKAIKLRQDIKDNNSKYFINKTVGSIFKFNVPNVFVSHNQLLSNYKQRLDLQEEDGISDLTIPETFNSDIHKLGNIIEKEEGGYIYTIETLTEKELDERIPTETPMLKAKDKLIELGVTDDVVIQTLMTALQMNLINNIDFEKLKVRWLQGNFLERKESKLFEMLPLLNNVGNLNITEEDIINLFKLSI